MRILLALVIAASLVAANSHIFPERLRHGRVYQEVLANERAHHKRIGFTPNTTKNWFTQLIDHNDPSKGTFQDKFYYNTQYWNGTGPCMMYLNGEGPLGGSVGGYMAEIAQKLGACTLSIEHRWYGESLPAPLTNKALLTSTLTVDQAMQDVAALIQYFEQTIIGRNVTWMLVGGSYSGGMTVWMNQKYPGKFKASWAASGVVRATFAFTEYDGHVKAVTSQDCSTALTLVMNAAVDAFHEDETRFKNMFQIPTYHTLTDILWSFADVSASSVQYSTRTSMCAAILPMPTEKWQALAVYANFIQNSWGFGFLQSCYYSTYCLSQQSMANLWGPAGYSWIWQCCSEVAWWQIGYPGSIRNINVSTTYFMEQCRAAFYPTTMADSWNFNNQYNGYHPVTKGNIIATQGSDDPWSTTGLKYNQGPTFPVNTAECANCGHCGSMMSPSISDPPQLQAQRELVLNSLTQWLAQP